MKTTTRRITLVTVLALAAVVLSGGCVVDDETAPQRGSFTAPVPTAAPAVPQCAPGACKTSVSGTGQRVVDLSIRGGGFCTITSTVRGNSSDYGGGTNFIVTMVDPDWSLWANEITAAGTFQTSERFERGSGSVAVEVDAEGSWTVTADCRG